MPTPTVRSRPTVTPPAPPRQPPSWDRILAAVTAIAGLLTVLVRAWTGH